jgi:membrane protease YdiL (CAAX protease family)
LTNRSSSPPQPTKGEVPPRPSPWPVVWAFAAAFFLTFGVSVLVVFGVAWLRVDGQRSRLLDEASAFALSATGLMAGALSSASVLALVALVGARLQGGPVAARLRLGPTRATLPATAVAVLGMMGLSVACGAATQLLGVGGSGVMDTMATALRGPSAGRFLASLVTIAIAPGLAEETFFRGWMQARLVASWGRWPGIATTALAFGLIHADLVQGTLAAVAGVYLGWIVERSGGIRPSIAAHVANNTLFVALAALGLGEQSSRGAALAVLLGGAAAWVASIAVLRRSRAGVPSEH